MQRHFFKVESTCSELSHRHRTNFASKEVCVCEAVFHHSCDHHTFIVSQKVPLLVKVSLLIVLLPKGLKQELSIITLHHGLAFPHSSKDGGAIPTFLTSHQEQVKKENYFLVLSTVTFNKVVFKSTI